MTCVSAPNPYNGAVSDTLGIIGPPGRQLTYSVTVAPGIGRLDVHPDGTYTYTPTQSAWLRSGQAPTTSELVDHFEVKATAGDWAQWEQVTLPIPRGRLVVSTAIDIGPPLHITTSPDDARLYAVSAVGADPGVLTIINTTDNSIIQNVPLDKYPGHMAVDPLGRHLYISHPPLGIVTVFDIAADNIRTIGVGGAPRGLAVSNDGSRLYVGDLNANTLTVIDTATRTTVRAIPVGPGPTLLAVTPDGRRLFVPCMRGTTVVNTADYSTQTITTPEDSQQVVVSPDGSRAYLTTGYAPDPNQPGSTGSVTVIDTATYHTETIAVGGSPVGVAISPDNTVVYVGNAPQGGISVIDTASHQIITTVGPFGDPPPADLVTPSVALSRDGYRIYVIHVFTTAPTSGFVEVLSFAPA